MWCYCTSIICNAISFLQINPYSYKLAKQPSLSVSKRFPALENQIIPGQQRPLGNIQVYRERALSTLLDLFPSSALPALDASLTGMETNQSAFSVCVIRFMKGDTKHSLPLSTGPPLPPVFHHGLWSQTA